MMTDTLTPMQTIPASWIAWDADEHPDYQVNDLHWYFDPAYPIEKIGGKAFIEKMRHYIDTEINDMLEDGGFDKNATSEYVAAQGEPRLAGWIALDNDIRQGKPFLEQVHIAEVPCFDEPYRHCIGDGWHRIGTAIKHNKLTIPAFVGVKKE